jgi:hypothetical protein
VPKTRTGKTYLRFKMSSYGVSGLPSKIKVSHPCFTWVYNLLFCWLLFYSNHTTHLVTNIPHLKLIKVVFVNPVELFFFKIYLKLIFYIFRLFWRTVIKNKF